MKCTRCYKGTMTPRDGRLHCDLCGHSLADNERTRMLCTAIATVFTDRVPIFADKPQTRPPRTQADIPQIHPGGKR